MLDKIVAALKTRDLAGWTVRHTTSRGAQVYAVPSGIEARRAVNNETYRVDVLCNTKAPDGSAATLKVMVNPMVMWIWLGGIIITFGALITIIPSRSRMTPTTQTLDLVTREPAGSLHYSGTR